MPKIVEDSQIYQAVIQVVIERGYAGATTKQMAGAAGVSEVTLFRKYGSKLQLVKQAISALAEQTDFESATCYTGDIETDITRVVQKYQDTVVKHGQFFVVLFSEFPRYAELAESFDKPLHFFKKIEILLTRYQEEGLLRQENPYHSISALLGPLMYATLMQRAVGGGLQPLDVHSHVASFLAGQRTNNA